MSLSLTIPYTPSRLIWRQVAYRGFAAQRKVMKPHPSLQHFTKEQLDAFREAKLEERREQMRQERAKFKQYMEMDQEREAEKKLEEKPSEIGFWRDFQMSFVENVLSDKMKAVMILYGLDTRKSVHHPKHPQMAEITDKSSGDNPSSSARAARDELRTMNHPLKYPETNLAGGASLDIPRIPLESRDYTECGTLSQINHLSFELAEHVEDVLLAAFLAEICRDNLILNDMEQGISVSLLRGSSRLYHKFLVPSFINMWFPFAWGVAIASSIGFAMPAAVVSAKGLTAFFFLRGGAAAAAVLWRDMKYPSKEPPESTPVVVREKEGMKFGFSQLTKGELAMLSFINLAAGAQYISALVDPSWASYALITGSTLAAGLFPKQMELQAGICIVFSLDETRISAHLCIAEMPTKAVSRLTEAWDSEIAHTFGNKPVVVDLFEGIMTCCLALGAAALAVGAPLGLMTGPYSVPFLELLPVQAALWYASSCVNYSFCHEGQSVPIAVTGVAAFGLAAYLGGLHQVFTTCWFLNSSFLLWRTHNNGFERAEWKARRLQGSDWLSKKHAKNVLQWWFGAGMIMATVMGRNFSSRSGMVHREADTESMSLEMKGTNVESRTARMTS
ncbi:hypothetical protein FOL47_008134 [Perkinsus chesapeaki]|uniref:Uncharacterized protein n=1 Tax=Perkinsus chesapeaki TaxID=330153 RepID=A0A7J6LFY2_PERCH|nr:hypothetical protein FOL47_008134 [Perkinsus chesapeaki]